MEIVQKTNAGFFYKNIPQYGALVYSPYTGLTYAVHQKYAKETIKWLKTGKEVNLPEAVRNPLSNRCKTAMEITRYPNNHLLPFKEEWESYVQPNELIAVNWLLTGLCNYDCQYCYATDLMKGNTIEPNESIVEDIAKQILAYNPLNVVLTGGEPLRSPFIKKAIGLLSRKTGIIIDTNGSLITPDLIDLFKKNNIVLRISWDSPRPKQNLKHRYIATKTDIYNLVLENIIKCIEADIPVIIQSVITSQNKNDLVAFGDILYRIGVTGWRLLKIQESKDNCNGFKELMLGRAKSIKQASSQLDYRLNNISRLQGSRWKSKFSIQISMNHVSDRNSVVLVSPNGQFWTESPFQFNKELIDGKNPFRPQIKKLFSRININAHYSRYLNLHNYVV